MSVTPYFFHCEGVSAIAAIPRSLTWQQWASIENGFLHLAVRRVKARKWAYVYKFPLYPSQQHAGVFWHEELAGPGGMGFVLLPGEASTADDIEACQRKLMRDRDVVRLTVVHTKKWRGAALAKLISSASAAGPRG